MSIIKVSLRAECLHLVVAGRSDDYAAEHYWRHAALPSWEMRHRSTINYDYRWQ